MKKYKLNPRTRGLPIGWMIGMVIVMPFIHITSSWWVMQLTGLSICIIIMLATMKKVDITDVKKTNEEKVNEVCKGFYDSKTK